MNLDDKIFEALESCRYVCETYDGHPEPRSLNVFHDSYKIQRKKGLNKHEALKRAGPDGIKARGLDRLNYHSDKSLDVLNDTSFDNFDLDAVKKEQYKGVKQSNRAERLANHSLNRK